MFQGYVFVGSFNYFPTNILRDIYAHTHRVSYGGIKKKLRVLSHPQKGVNRNIDIVYRSPLWAYPNHGVNRNKQVHLKQTTEQ